MRIELLGKKFVYWVKLHQFDYRNNDYGPSIEFMYDDEKPQIRGHEVGLKIRYLWFREEAWVVYDTSDRWDENKLKWVAAKAEGWMKKYFDEFLRQWPNWETELTSRAIEYTMDNLASALRWREERLLEAKIALAAIDTKQPLNLLIRDLTRYENREGKNT